MEKQRKLKCDVTVVGSGMSGMAAALFAARDGLSVVQISHHTPLINHSGTLDLMSCTPLQGKKIWKNPLKGIRFLVGENRDHPYAKLDPEEIRDSLNTVKQVLKQQDLLYRGSVNKNRRVMTSLGTFKPACLIPATMWNGEKAFNRQSRGLIVDIQGLRGFSAREIIETVKSDWPGLKSARIRFPGLEDGKEAVPESMARSLENRATLQAFADVLRPVLEDVEVIGLPAILGINHSLRVHRDLEKLLGLPVFEIPSMPPSVPGMRLNETFAFILGSEGVRSFQNRKAEAVTFLPSQRFSIRFENNGEIVEVDSASLVIASGRFSGHGLSVNGEGIRETLLDIPVQQPELKTDWYQARFFGRSGHGINRAGIVTDRFFRPVKSYPEPLYPNLFTVGAINACQDWVREKSGSGLSITSAYKAVQGVRKFCRLNHLS